MSYLIYLGPASIASIKCEKCGRNEEIQLTQGYPVEILEFCTCGAYMKTFEVINCQEEEEKPNERTA